MKLHIISIIGTGYVGLSTALGFTSKGYTVITLDPDKEKSKKKPAQPERLIDIGF